jgi:hypothetical protein
MDSVSNRRFKITVYGFSVNVERNGAGGHQWDNRAILALSKAFYYSSKSGIKIESFTATPISHPTSVQLAR